MDGGQFPADYSVLTCEAYQAGERINRTNLDLMAAMKAVRLRSEKSYVIIVAAMVSGCDAEVGIDFVHRKGGLGRGSKSC